VNHERKITGEHSVNFSKMSSSEHFLSICT